MLTRLFILAYMAFMLIAICTSDPHAFLYQQIVSFKINSTPAFTDLFIVGDIPWTSSFYLIQKGSHIIGFGVLYILLLRHLKNIKTAFVISGLFALLTEILQLYFSRSGRLFDVGIDLLGILLAYSLCKYLKVETKI